MKSLSLLLAPGLVGSLLLIPLSAYANEQETGLESAAQGTSDGRSISAMTSIRTTAPGPSGANRPNPRKSTLTPRNTRWTPPPCWYEPAFSPREIQQTVKRFRQFQFFGIGDAVGNLLDAYYKDGHPYHNYNLDKQNKGMFWSAVVNPNRKHEPGAAACDKLPFWVDKGTTPDEPLAVKPQVLAEYAYDELNLPDTDIQLRPRGTNIVNLPTWAWLDKGTFKPVSVTASLPGTGLSATTRAKPVALRLSPGTDDAELHPASGECRIHDTGDIGVPYTTGASMRTPPCGVTYLRSTTGRAPYPLKATVLWEISWHGSDGRGGTLPDGAFGTSRDIEVQEVQTVVH